MRHVLVCYQNACGNAHLTQVHYVVCCVALETLIWGTSLLHDTFSRTDNQHLYYVAHDPLVLSTFLLELFLCFTWSIIPTCVINLTNVFEITVLNSSWYFVLIGELPFGYQTFYYQGVGK